MSQQIAKRLGWLASAQGSRKTFGAMIDIAELWELFVVRCTQRAASSVGLHAKHSTKEAAAWAVATNLEGEALSRVIPDVLVYDRAGAYAVLDAKYKSLRATRQRPRGFRREDLYQLITYMERFAVDGALVYPLSGTPGSAATIGPWRTESGRTVVFIALPTRKEQARSALAMYLRRPDLKSA